MKKPKGPEFVSHREIAARLGVIPKTVRRWVKLCNIPAPAFEIGTNLFWRATDVETFTRTGKWPAHSSPG